MATTPVFLLGKSHGHRSLVGSSPWGRKELGTTEWLILTYLNRIWSSQVALVVKNPPAKVGDVTDAGLIPGSGRSPGEGHGNPFLYSWLENPMNRGAWGAAVHRVAKSRTWLKKLSMHTEDIWYAFILGRQLGMAVGGNLKFDGLVFWILVVRCLEQATYLIPLPLHCRHSFTEI